MTTTHLRPLALALCIFGLHATGCSEIDESVELDAAEEELVEIIDNLLTAGYSEDAIEILDGLVIVDGDGVVNLEASREMAATDSEGFRQYHHDNLVTVSDICVDGSNFSSGYWSTALDDALHEFNSLGLEFTLRRTGANPSGCGAVIEAQQYTTNTTGGLGEYPSSGNPGAWFKVGTDIYANYGHDRVVAVILHELGHNVGIRHTDHYDTSISCGNSGSNSGTHHHIPGTPTTASMDGSLMNACYNSGTQPNWTDSDVVAFRYLYGTSFCDAYDGRQVALETAHDRFLKTASGTTSQQTYIGNHETMTIDCVGDKVAIRNLWGKYLRAGSSGESWVVNLQTHIGTWEKWTPVLQANGDWAFQSYHGRWLRAGNSGESWRFNQQSSVGSWEKFTLFVL